MVKWIKLSDNQYLGFWFLGLLLFAIQEIPYMLMPLFHLETNPIMNMQESSVVLNICEKVLGSICIASMIFIVHKDAVLFSIDGKSDKLLFALAVITLLANFGGWALYFMGHQSITVMLFFIVLMPPLYYALIGLWRKNIFLAVVGFVFLLVHFLHVWSNLSIIYD